MGTYFSKYDYNAEYYKIGTWGHASNVNKAGVWVVLGSYEFLNDGPVKQDLTIAAGYTVLHYGRNHYDGSDTSVAAGETWAKAKAQTERAAWPYSWLTTNSLYPQASGRGTVTGTFIVNDRLKPSLTGGGAWGRPATTY